MLKKIAVIAYLYVAVYLICFAIGLAAGLIHVFGHTKEFVFVDFVCQWSFFLFKLFSWIGICCVIVIGMAYGLASLFNKLF